MRRKCPRTGDIVRWKTDGKSTGWVMRCEGIHVLVRFFEPEDFGHIRGVLLRRDKMEVISSANN
jgi:hypothetical protein